MIRKVFIFCILIMSCPAVWAQTVVRGPYLQSATPSSIVIRWRTDVATDSMAHFGITHSALDQQVSESTQTTEHEIKLQNLIANTKYFYSIGTSSVTLAADSTHFFLTAPPTGSKQPFRVWILGDSGTGSTTQLDVYSAYKNFAPAITTNFWIMLGDNAYSSGSDDQYQDKLFKIYPELLRSSALFPTVGNHDKQTSAGAPYKSIFTLPLNGESGGWPTSDEFYYSYNWGNAHFIVLDSEINKFDSTTPMYQWITNDLQNLDSGIDHVIAYWHQSPFSHGSHNSDFESGPIKMRADILPLLESLGVDIVFTGHSHGLERSYLLNGFHGTSAEFDPTKDAIDLGDGNPAGDGAYKKSPGVSSNGGTVYTVAGNGGQAHSGTYDHKAMTVSTQTAGSIVLDISGGTLHVRALSSTGNIFDEFEIKKEEPVIVSAPTLGSISPNPIVLDENLQADTLGLYTIKLTGNNFFGENTVALASIDGTPEIPYPNVTLVSDTEISLKFSGFSGVHEIAIRIAVSHSGKWYYSNSQILSAVGFENPPPEETPTNPSNEENNPDDSSAPGDTVNEDPTTTCGGNLEISLKKAKVHAGKQIVIELKSGSTGYNKPAIIKASRIGASEFGSLGTVLGTEIEFGLIPDSTFKSDKLKGKLDSKGNGKLKFYVPNKGQIGKLYLQAFAGDQEDCALSPISILEVTKAKKNAKSVLTLKKIKNSIKKLSKHITDLESQSFLQAASAEIETLKDQRSQLEFGLEEF